MTPIDKCLQTLQVLVKASDIKAIGLAENAIDEFVAAQVGRDRQTDALNMLDRNLVLLRKQVVGPSAEFADVVFDYIGKQFAALRDD
jgi:aryl-alcohol dehydrogenase-like predicted oxidoreductase